MKTTLFFVAAMASALAIGCGNSVGEEGESPDVDEDGLSERVSYAYGSNTAYINGFGQGTPTGSMIVKSYQPTFTNGGSEPNSGQISAYRSSLQGTSGGTGIYWIAGNVMLYKDSQACTYDYQCNDPNSYLGYCLKVSTYGGLGNPMLNVSQRVSGGTCYRTPQYYSSECGGLCAPAVTRGVRVPASGTLDQGEIATVPVQSSEYNLFLRRWVTMTVYTPRQVLNCTGTNAPPSGSCCGDITPIGSYGLKRYESANFCRRVISDEAYSPYEPYFCTGYYCP